MQEDLFSFFIRVQSQLKVMHWQTKSYARHMAYGRIYDALDDLIDSFVEIYQGKYGRVAIQGPITILNIDEDALNSFIEDTTEILTNDVTEMLKETDTDLLNIRDEIIAQFSQLRYLVTLG